MIDLGWGESVVVRQALTENLSGKPITFHMDDLANMGYTNHDGDPAIIEKTRKVIERQTGLTYKHILLTNGATGGVTIALRAYAHKGYKYALTRHAPYYGMYPVMIRGAGLEHKTLVDIDDCLSNKTVILIDSPTNPLGTEATGLHGLGAPIVWDAVYHNRVYTTGLLKPFGGDVMVGSYSKLLGLNGVRLGWMATNDDLVYLRLKDLVEAEYCGLSGPSAVIVNRVLDDLVDDRYWHQFERAARFRLDWNREQWSVLEKYFGDTPVVDVGMFYFAPTDAACKRLLEKAGINWMTGSKLGHNDDFGRINLGQDCKLIKQAVKEILKQDKIK